jgi:multidrug efflux system membrane fusion protein
LLVALTVVLAAAVVGCLLLRSLTSKPRAEIAIGVHLGTVTRGEMPVTTDGLGVVIPLSMVLVKSQINGYLNEVGFYEGQIVRKDEFLAEIDPRTYQAALDQMQGQLARDDALLAAAKVDLARYEKLKTQDSIATQQVDTQRALVLQDEAVVKSDIANVEAAKLNLFYCRIVAPSSGRLGLRLVDAGNYVQAGDPSGLVVITQMQPISVIFNLPQDDIPRFIGKLRGGLPLQVLAFDRASTALLATGTLAAIDNQIDVTTGTVRLRALFSNQDETLFPNQFVAAKLVVDTLHGATLVPNASLREGAPGSFVYALNPDTTISARPVRLGPSDQSRTVVLEGLSPGDKVAVDGFDQVRDGTKVRELQP